MARAADLPHAFSRWREGVVVSLWLLAGLLWATVAVPVSYESSALVEVDQAADAPGPAAGLQERLRAALCDPSRLERLSALASPARSQPCRAIGLRPEGAKRWLLAFSASGPNGARRGAAFLAHELERLSAPADAETAAGRRLEQATRTLAAFIAQHPDLPAGPAPEPSAAARAAPPPVDGLLVQQRTRLEAELAQAKAGPDPSQDNPYDDPKPKASVAEIERKLAEVKAAMAARRAAADRVHASADAGAGDAGSFETVVSEWHKLVAEVVKAQARMHAGADGARSAALGGLTVRVVRDADVPLSPTASERPTLLTMSGPFSLAVGVFWALGRAGALRPGGGPRERRARKRELAAQKLAIGVSIEEPVVELLMAAGGGQDVLGSLTRIAARAPPGQAEGARRLLAQGELAAAEQEALRLLNVQGASVEAWQTLAVLRERRGNFATAVLARQNAVRAAGAAGLAEKECALQIDLGALLTAIGARTEARAALAAALEIARRENLPQAVRRAHAQLVTWTATFGAEPALDAELAEIRALAGRAAEGGWVATDSTGLGLLYNRATELLARDPQGAADDCAVLLETAVGACRTMSNGEYLPAALAALARAELARRQTKRARALAEQAGDLVADAKPGLVDSVPIYLALHDCRLAEGDESAAKEAVAVGALAFSRRLRGVAGTAYARPLLGVPNTVRLLDLARGYGVMPADLRGQIETTG